MSQPNTFITGYRPSLATMEGTNTELTVKVSIDVFRLKLTEQGTAMEVVLQRDHPQLEVPQTSTLQVACHVKAKGHMFVTLTALRELQKLLLEYSDSKPFHVVKKRIPRDRTWAWRCICETGHHFGASIGPEGEVHLGSRVARFPASFHIITIPATSVPEMVYRSLVKVREGLVDDNTRMPGWDVTSFQFPRSA